VTNRSTDIKICSIESGIERNRNLVTLAYLRSILVRLLSLSNNEVPESTIIHTRPTDSFKSCKEIYPSRPMARFVLL